MAHWKLASSDHTMALDLNAADNGALNGALTYAGASYNVAGGWDAAGSVPGRNYSALSVSGRTPSLPDVPNWISASGIMAGARAGAAPTKISGGGSPPSGGGRHPPYWMCVPRRFGGLCCVAQLHCPTHKQHTIPTTLPSILL